MKVADEFSQHFGKSCKHAQSHTDGLINTSAVAGHKSDCFKTSVTIEFQAAIPQPFFRLEAKRKMLV